MAAQLTRNRRIGLSEVVAGTLARFLFALPVSWLIYTLGFGLARCYALALDGGQCLELVVWAPASFMIPVMAHDQDPPLAFPYLQILLIALAIAISWTIASLISKYRRTRGERILNDTDAV
jgi:hypothetical protein